MKTDVPDRRTGKTTQQMLSAPTGAIFIWCNANLCYPNQLAEQLGRDDLNIVPPRFLESSGMYGHRKPIVVDHHASSNLTYRQVNALVYHSGRVFTVR